MADRVTQVATEVLDQSTVLKARVTQVATEVLDQSTVLNVRVTQVAVEVLAAVSATVVPQPMMVVGFVG